MRRFVPLLLAAATAAAAPWTSPRSAAHPDFSGTWTLDVSKSEGPMLPTASTFKITQTEKSMIVVPARGAAMEPPYSVRRALILAAPAAAVKRGGGGGARGYDC